MILNDDQYKVARLVFDLLPKDQVRFIEEEILIKVKIAAQVFEYNEDLSDITRYVEANVNCSMGLGVSLLEDSETHDKNWIDRITLEKKIYAKSYENHLKNGRISPFIVNNISRVNDEILRLLDDPEKEQSFQRRGLVIGDVQSGKTSNYLSLITKAADAGYKFIIVIAGIHNNLRKQTQQRIDEGFVGRESLQIKGRSKVIGVGLDEQGKQKRNYPHPISLTSQEQDFNGRFATQLQTAIQGFAHPVILVIKKNVTTLKNLHQWLEIFNLNDANSINKIDDVPMLLIDDEADNASINTNSPDADPTKTNHYIRAILHMFSKSCYVGYTATPYANIFIDPAPSDNEVEDLFPRDFIYCLDAPSNYFGPRKIFLDETQKTIVSLDSDEVEKYILAKHKKDFEVTGLPESLKSAILNFIIAKSIRNLRGEEAAHCSMLINVSTYVEVQKKIKGLVDDFCTDVENELINFGAMPNAESKPLINKLKRVYENEYFHIKEEFSWAYILRELIRMYTAKKKNYISKVVVVNSKSQDTLDFDEAKKAKLGLMVIAIGGFSLSRGLTIEGLTVSYFFRSTQMYDTLLQMGRWFGYRPGFEDLCRLYMTPEAYIWYQHITQATDDLRNQVIQMNQNNMTPKDFGLYVRDSDDGLLITARNKMRSGVEGFIECSFAGKLEELNIISSDHKVQIENYKLMKDFWGNLSVNHLERKFYTSADTYTNVETRSVISFLRKYIYGFDNSEYNYAVGFAKSKRATMEAAIEYLKEISFEYQTMDVFFISKELSSEKEVEEFEMLNAVERQVFTQKVANAFSLNKSRVGGQRDESFGYQTEYKESEGSNEAEYYRRKRNKPLLMLYLIKPTKHKTVIEKDANLEIANGINGIPTFSLSFPFSKNRKTIKILANQLYFNSFGQILEDDLEVV